MVRTKTKQIIPDNIWEEFESESDKIKDFDISKLNLSAEDNEVLDIFFKKYLDPEEDFPQGERHSIIEKNLAIYIIKNNLPLEDIKKAYQSKGYKANSLLSQIRGVTNGTYGEEPYVNIGELVNWCKKYREDLVDVFREKKLIDLPEEKFTIKKQNPFKKLHLSTDHLPYYHEFSSLIGLLGRQYIPIVKARWYQLHGGFIQKTIKLGGLITDTRVHVAYPLPTESGKNDIIYSIKGLVELDIKKINGKPFTASEPISFHQEALIGKMVERMIENPAGKPKMIKTKIENLGHLNNDFVDFDECNQLIKGTAPELQQAREYLSKAENPIGRNRVEKRSVDDLPSETISYCPNSTHSYYFQPFQKLPESFVLQGFGRRKLIPLGDVRDFLTSASESSFDQKISFDDKPTEDYQNLLKTHLTNVVSSSNGEYSFTDKALELIKQYALYISAQGDIHSEKISNFCKIAKWTALSNLIKFSCIIANSYYTNEVNEDFVSLAYMDLVELMQKTYDFINERIEGEFDYGTKWNGADSKQRELLRYLYDRGCFSEESSDVPISRFIHVVAEDVYRVKEVQARNRYLDMKKKGLIDSRQISNNETRVWLKFRPEDHKNMVEGDKGYKGYTVYNTLFLSKKDILRRIKPL